MSENEIQQLMSQGNQLLRSGQLEAAKPFYQKVIAFNPDTSEAHFCLGWIAYREKDAKRACEHLDRAFAISPEKKYFEALINVYMQTQQFGAAVSVFETYLNTETENAELYFQYGVALANNKQHEKAIVALEKSIALQPQALNTYMQLGNLYYQLLRFREAHRIYKDAFKKGLKSEGLYLNIAKLDTDFGDLDHARLMLEKGLEDFPNNLVFAYRLSAIDDAFLSSGLADRLQQSQQTEQSPEQTFYRLWLQSRFARKSEAYDQEMQYLIEAHAIFADMTRFHHSVDYYLKTLPALPMPAYATEQEPLDQEISAMKPIFIVGMPRCGSTLIENIICAGPTRIPKGEETSTILQALEAAKQQNTEQFWTSFQQKAHALFQHHQLGGEESFTDKSLENIFLIGFILTIYPKARIIFCDRTPLASIVSILRNNMSVLPWAHRPEHIFQYAENCRHTITQFQAQYPSRILHVRYEDLVVNPVKESQRIMAFCELPWSESCLAFHKREDIVSRTASHMQIRSGINQDALNREQAFTGFFRDYLERYPGMTRSTH